MLIVDDTIVAWGLVVVHGGEILDVELLFLCALFARFHPRLCSHTTNVFDVLWRQLFPELARTRSWKRRQK